MALPGRLRCLHPDVLRRAVLMYIKVSYEESVRKNRRRARKGEEDSILYHSLPDEKMEFYYRENDWEDLAAKDPNVLDVNGFKVPYAVFENEPEKTLDLLKLGEELERIMKRLWLVRQPERHRGRRCARREYCSWLLRALCFVSGRQPSAFSSPTRSLPGR